MRKRLFMAVVVACLFLVGCTEKKEPVVVVDSSTVPEEKDSTIYGVCGDGTSMNSIQLVTGQGDTLIFMKTWEKYFISLLNRKLWRRFSVFCDCHR